MQIAKNPWHQNDSRASKAFQSKYCISDFSCIKYSAAIELNFLPESQNWYSDSLLKLKTERNLYTWVKQRIFKKINDDCYSEWVKNFARASKDKEEKQ